MSKATWQRAEQCNKHAMRDDKQRWRKAEKGVECKTSSEVAEGQFHLRVCKCRRAGTMATNTGGQGREPARAAMWLKPHATSPPMQQRSGVAGLWVALQQEGHS